MCDYGWNGKDLNTPLSDEGEKAYRAAVKRVREDQAARGRERLRRFEEMLARQREAR